MQGDEVAAYNIIGKEIESLNSISTSEKKYQCIFELEPASSKFALPSDNEQEIAIVKEEDENVTKFVERLVSY